MGVRVVESGRSMRRFLSVVVCGVVAAGFAVAPAAAQDGTVITVPVDTVVRGAPGSEYLVASVAVAAEDVGRQCSVAAEGINQESVHPNSDLLVRSGGGEVALLDVEREANVRTEATGTLTLGTDVSVFVRLGPDGLFSGGLVLTIDCPTLGAEGCTPGFWKNHLEAWAPTGFAPDQALGSVFDAAGLGSLAPDTLSAALSYGGGSGLEAAKQILLRQAVAALLNAAHPDVDFALTTAEVIAAVNAALGSGSRSAILATKDELTAANEAGCDLS